MPVELLASPETKDPAWAANNQAGETARLHDPEHTAGFQENPEWPLLKRELVGSHSSHHQRVSRGVRALTEP